MTAVKYLPGITQDEAEKLRQANIKTVDELWARAGKDIDGLAEQVGLPKERLLDLLAEQALVEREGVFGSWTRRAWLSLDRNWLLVAIGGLALLLMWLVLCMPAAPAAVVSARQMPALHLVGLDDVEHGEAGGEPGSFATIEDVVGRYTLQAIPADTVLQEGHLSRFRATEVDEATLAGRGVVAVPVADESLSSEVLENRVWLLFTPREDGGAGAPAESFLLDDVIVLAAAQGEDGARLVIAVREADLEALGRYLGRSEVYVVQGGN